MVIPSEYFIEDILSVGNVGCLDVGDHPLVAVSSGCVSDVHFRKHRERRSKKDSQLRAKASRINPVLLEEEVQEQEEVRI